MSLPVLAAVAAGTTLVGAVFVGVGLYIHAQDRADQARRESDQLRQDLQHETQRQRQARDREEARTRDLHFEALRLRLFLLRQQTQAAPTP